MTGGSQDAARRVYTRDEILDSGSYEAPLVANGVRCHGGFSDSGEYRSPRLLHRGPAIQAWQAQLAREGALLVEIDPGLMPPQYPNVAQAALLLRHGVRAPVVRALTLISIVEGFGAVIRDVKLPDLSSQLREPIDGTALAHLGAAGLFEAHARDESGYRDQGGHKQMWEAARDLALENPKIPGDVLMRLMGRRPGARSRERAFPQIDVDLETLLATMAQVMVIEVFAMGTFAWGEELLGDPEISAAPREAADLVRFIRSDESPHVEYLRTALSELRARTVVTVDGGEMAGSELVDGMLHRVLRSLTGDRPAEQRKDARSNLSEEMQSSGAPDGLLEEFDSLESAWIRPTRTGFEPESRAASA